MRFRNLAMPILFGVITMTYGSNASPLDESHWKSRILVVITRAGDPAAEAQRRIYESSAQGMSERAVILAEALDGSERSKQIRSQLSADGRLFLVGKDGQTAISSDKPLSADYLFARVDAMPMRQDEMRRAR